MRPVFLAEAEARDKAVTADPSKAKRIEVQDGEIKLKKQLTNKDLFGSFRKDSYGSHRPKCSVEKHSRYKRSLVTNKVINKETQNAA